MSRVAKRYLAPWAALMLAAAMSPSAGGAVVWQEGEQPAVHQMNRHPWWYDKVKTQELSGGAWLSNFHDDKQGQAEYRVNVPTAGRYVFWLRANPVKSKLSYQINEGSWAEVDFSAATDTRNIAADGKPDLRFIAWVKIGEFDFERGGATIRFRTHSEPQNHGAIDVFVLTDEPFFPKGAARPGKQEVVQSVADAETWPFQPGRDTFRSEALLDLRYLNEDVAGETGFVRLTEDGRDFAHGDGTPLRFWAAHSSVYRKGPDALAEHARFLAKRGVNLVRWHGQICPKDTSSKLTEIDEKARDELWQYVAAMKKEGIYLVLSPYYAMPIKPQPGWGIPRAGKDMHGLLYFDPRLQAAYKEWLRAIFEPVNPYTGVPLKDEPAVAVIQLQNEDSLLFWTVMNLQGGDLEILQQQYAAWLNKKYGALPTAARAWDGFRADGDDFARGRVGFRHIWELTQPVKANSGQARRLADQTQFWTEAMYRFNADMVRFLRQQIGAKQLTNATNWKTADPVRLNDCERYSYTAADVIAVNRYCGDTHIGKHRGWAIVNGDRFQDRSVLVRPETLPTSLKQVAGHPMIITESNWVPPRGYQSEGPFLSAVYQSLNGVDALFWFNIGEPQWRQPASANGYLPSLGKWVAHTPQIMGNFPAAALLHRRGDVRAAGTAVREYRRLDDLWNRRVPIISETGTYDPNRDAGDYAPESKIKQEVDRLAFLVGGVEVTYDADPGRNHVIDLDRFIDQDKRIVRSATGEVVWDYGRGICALTTPKAVGVTGFLNEVGTFRLGDVAVQSKNAYATIMVVSLDDQPLAASGKVLVQVGTMARPTDWAQRPVTWQDKDRGEVHGFEIVNYGQAPWRITNTQCAVAIKNSRLSQATLLDVNGYALREVPAERRGERVIVQLPPETMYLVLR